MEPGPGPAPRETFPERVLPKLRRAAMSAAAIEADEMARLFTATADQVEMVAAQGPSFDSSRWGLTRLVAAVERLAEAWL